MSQNTYPHKKRKRIFIKKDYQFKFVLKFCVLVLVGAIVSTGLLFLFCQDTLTSSFEQSRLVIRSTSLAILPAVIYTNLITLVLITVATIIVTLYISHRLAGPLYRFEEGLKEVGAGDLTKDIRLRKKDQIQDMAAGLNKMIDSLRDKVFTIQSDVKQLLESASKQNAPEGVIEELDSLHRKIGNVFRI